MTDINLRGEACSDQEFQDLFDFVAAHGASIDSVCIGRDQYGGRGLFATRPIPAGGIVAVLPRALRIGQKEACATVAIPHNTPDLSALSLLLLAYLDEELKPGDCANNWGIYARTLPCRGEFTNAVVMSTSEIEAWSSRSAEYEEAILSVKKRAHSCVTYISEVLNNSEPLPDDSALTWAISMVLSRSHAFGSVNGRWLTPLLDMANYRPASCGGGTLSSDDQGRIVLRAGSALDIGDEVTLDYQCGDDAQMVATYGFSTVSNVSTVSTLAPGSEVGEYF